MKFKCAWMVALAAVFSGCASTSKGRVFLDSSTHEDRAPDWVSSLKHAWELDGKVYFKVSHTIKGNERLNGCFDLSHLDAREVLISEISSDIKGSLA